MLQDIRLSKQGSTLFAVINSALSGSCDISFFSFFLPPPQDKEGESLLLIRAHLSETDSHYVCFIFFITRHRSTPPNHRRGLNEKENELLTLTLYLPLFSTPQIPHLALFPFSSTLKDGDININVQE